MAKVVVITVRAHIFPALASKQTNRVALIQEVLAELFPHFTPLAVAGFDKFHGWISAIIIFNELF